MNYYTADSTNFKKLAAQSYTLIKFPINTDNNCKFPSHDATNRSNIMYYTKSSDTSDPANYVYWLDYHSTEQAGDYDTVIENLYCHDYETAQFDIYHLKATTDGTDVLVSKLTNAKAMS